ncbi:hypothetical protein [Sphaerisporangium fuscum]|uniref:hypothetical protein n=1 Tax=Sphaerisporangium fuscum TaxID=2835868 RepID=UPI001BDBBBD5|nr:hypothetical protein [Sphaerisporangium fuscum]
MSQEYLSQHSSLNEAGLRLLDAADLFQRHTSDLLAAVRGTGGTAWGGSVTGMVMNELADLLHQSCAHVHGNLNRIGEAVHKMERHTRASELEVEAAARAVGSRAGLRAV